MLLRSSPVPKSDQGVTADRYRVIPRTLIFVTRGEEVLLIQGAPTKRLWANLYNGLGGHIERGEDILTAAKRELEEETGLRGVDLRLVGSVLIDVNEHTGISLFVFKGGYREGELRISREGNLEWVPFDRLADYPLVEDLKILLPRVLAMQPGDAPFAARYWYDAREQMQIGFGE
jgi:8-oxo-dGTP diphosphatase